MALKSPLLQGNARLQQASERPPSIAPLPALEPDTQAVQKIQQALVQLGLADSPALMEGINAAVETYGKSERNKYRAVFYYLLVKHFGKEAVYG